ncbi:MAG: tagatose 1,6-diphosphate aldolase [Chloroflexota bacterium]
MTTMGKLRHMSRCATDDGHFVVMAIDHRAVLRDKLNEHAPRPVDDAAFTTFKQQVVRALIPDVAAVLLDPAFGIGAGLVERTITGRHGLLAPLEVTNYDLHPSRRDVNFIPGWSVAKIKRVGGDGVKLLLPYHPESDSAADKQDVVRRIVDECAVHDIPFFLEPIAHAMDPEKPLYNAELLDVVVEMARVFSHLDADVLKMQVPVDAKQSDDETTWREACNALDEACSVPWALLSAGVNYETFALQAKVACEAGASGVIVGRAVWAEAVELQGAERETFVTTTARERMQSLAGICREHATPYYKRVTMPHTTPDWFETY